MVAACKICSNYYERGTNVIFHKLPSNEEVKRQWENIIQSSSFQRATKHIFICSDHFTYNDYTQSIGNINTRILKKNAIPSRNISTTGLMSNEIEAREISAIIGTEDSPPWVKDATTSMRGILTNLDSENNQPLPINVTPTKRAKFEIDDTIFKTDRVHTKDVAVQISRPSQVEEKLREENRVLKQRIRRQEIRIKNLKQLAQSLRKAGRRNEDIMMGKRRRLTILERAKIINEVEAGKTATGIAKKYHLSQAAVSKMMRNKEKIVTYIQKVTDYGDPTKKKINNIEDTTLDRELYHWFTEMKANGTPVSGPIIRQKALVLNKINNGDKNFKASSGWLTRWKKRHRIRLTSKRSKKLSTMIENSNLIQDDQNIKWETLDDSHLSNVNENEEVPDQNDDYDDGVIQLEELDEEIIKSKEALEFLDKFQIYYQTLNCDEEDLVMMAKLRNNVVQHALRKVKLPS